MTELCQLAEKYGTDKLYHYTPFYDLLFRGIRGNVRAVLEIGVKDGASLRMWADYFPGAKIYGMDIKPAPLNDDRIFAFFGDQSKEADLQHAGELGPFDLIVDDGSHKANEQILGAVTLMPFVREGGLYIIEDVNLGMDPPFEYTTVCHHHFKDRSIAGRCILIRK